MTTLDKEEARQGETGQGLRYVLGVSLALGIIALGTILASFVA